MTCKENDSQDKKIDRELAALMKRLHDAISRIYDDAEKDKVLAGYLEKYIKLTTTDFQRMNYDEVKNQRFLESAILAPAFASFREVYGEGNMTCRDAHNTWNRILEVLQTKERSAYVKYLYSLVPQNGEPYIKENREKLARLVKRYLEVIRAEIEYAEEYAEELLSETQLSTIAARPKFGVAKFNGAIYRWLVSMNSGRTPCRPTEFWLDRVSAFVVFLVCFAIILLTVIY